MILSLFLSFSKATHKSIHKHYCNSYRQSYDFSWIAICLRYARYMEFDHLRHCVPDDEFSGLHSLPLTHKYVDGVMVKSDPALRTLPTGELLNGSQSYLRLLSFFTPNNETPEHLRSEGIRRLSHLLLKVGLRTAGSCLFFRRHSLRRNAWLCHISSNTIADGP